MDKLFPSPVENVDPVELYAADNRPGPPGRPWVLTNMISSIDGAVVVDGLSGGLGGPADKAVFRAIRGVADVIVAASGTVVAENYGPPQTPDHIQKMRVERGQDPLPRIAVVTNSAKIDPAHSVFDSASRPILVTREQAEASRVDAIAAVAEVIKAGSDTVDLGAMLVELGKRGAKTVLVEGGPTLNAAFVAEDLVDEFCLSFAPILVGGNGPRAVGAMDSSPAYPMSLDRVLHEDGLLFHRYLRNRT